MAAKDAADDHEPPARFATTRWSLVLAAQPSDGQGDSDAIAVLCGAYWYPLYAFARRRGMNAEDARDATQEFFCRVLERQYLHLADPSRGRFRSFLLTVFKRFLSAEFARKNTLKRGGETQTFSIDAVDAERRYALEPADSWTPDALFDRRWALTLLDEVVGRLETEYARKERGDFFAACRHLLTTPTRDVNYAALSAPLGMTPVNVRVAVHRLRDRYRILLKEAVAETLADPDETDAELNCLLAALRGEK